jgi:outer membrane receptor protein involved in Fe transport
MTIKKKRFARCFGNLLGWLACAASSLLIVPSAHASGVPTLDVVEVTASPEDLVGTADAASVGTVTDKQLETRPLLRPAEVLETVPGVIITQHSGDGKANQYFLRGFNLDHGTDFAVTLAGMPVNMPTHAHGQGYADLNFLIPELVKRVQYKKGPYFADEGDFSSAGAANIEYVRRLPEGVVDVGAGEYGYRRALVAASPQAGNGTMLYAVEAFHNDGPWDHPEDYRRVNGVLRYSHGNAQGGFALTGMFYRGEWDSTDQIPERAIESGLVSRFGALDPSDGGETHRYSLSAEWTRSDDRRFTQAGIYVIDYGLDLFSNFTFFLNDPVNGDQFEQFDRRTVSGADVSHTWIGRIGDTDTEHRVGLRLRNDDIGEVALYATRERHRLSTVRNDRVQQTSIGTYYQNATQWTDWFRSVAGLRGDAYRFHVESDDDANSGTDHDGITSPKLSLIFGPWSRTEYFVNMGYGFHSNDARGATIKVDPTTGTPVERVSPLVRAKAAELGLRTAIVPHLQSTIAFWRLDIDSELVFVGDAGTTEASFPSRRRGVEWTNYYTPTAWLTIDADLAWSHARFEDNPAGDRIPGAIERTASVGVGVSNLGGWFGGLRLRHFGPRPLIEDNSVRSDESTLVNLLVGYRPAKALRVTMEVLNLFDREVSDIDYYYESQLAGEPAPVADIHTHPAEPRTVRLTLAATF